MNCKEKAMHGEFNRKADEIETDGSWRWIQNSFLKKEREGMMLAAQEQEFGTNSMKFSVD